MPLCSSCCSRFTMTVMEPSVISHRLLSVHIASMNILIIYMYIYTCYLCCLSSGRLYQTHPKRGQNLVHDPRPGLSGRLLSSYTSTLPPSLCTSSSSAPPSNYNDYQNCNIIQSHLPCSGYGTYVTPESKTLIFPVFVQVRTQNMK